MKIHYFAVRAVSLAIFTLFGSLHLRAQLAAAPDAILNMTYVSIRAAGDLNNDGYDDMFNLRYDYTFGGISNRGKVELYLGSSTGLVPIPAWTVMGDTAKLYMGSDVTVGDFNNDGLNDFAVSASPQTTSKGRVWIFMQSVTGFPATPSKSYSGPTTGTKYGSCVEAIDINHDGYDDLVVSETEFDNTYTNAGKLYVYTGSASGLNTTAAYTTEGNFTSCQMGRSLTRGDFNADGYDDLGSKFYSGFTASFTAIFKGSASGDLIADDTLGYESGVSPDALCAGQDINGDGYDDLLSSSSGGSFISVVVIHYGSVEGLTLNNYDIVYSTDSSSINPWEVGGADMLGDVNGDGFSDFIVGAPYDNTPATDAGRIHVFMGSSGHPSLEPDWTYTNTVASEKFGYRIQGIGDVNGDGYDDACAGFSSKDQLYIFYGSPSGLNTIGDAAFHGSYTSNWYGYSVDGLGDYNMDGFDDQVIGSPGTGLYDGKGVEVIRGGTTGPKLAQLIFDEAYEHNGWQVSNAGDINGDNQPDMLMSGYRCFDYVSYLLFNNDNVFGFDSMWTSCKYDYADQPFRVSVEAAGDVNNDGFDDFLVGGIGKSSTENHPTASAVRLFFGLPTMQKYDTTVVATVDTYLWMNNFTQDSCDFGRSMSALGDINGDGYDDFMVSAPRYDEGQTNEGKIHVYLGAAGIPSYTPSWTYQSDQAFAQAGYSTANAGDINGDGYTDIIIGAPYYDNGQTDEGVVFIFYGNATGFPATPSLMIESNQASSNFGISVDGIGDYNGDGYADIVVGAHKYDNGQTDEGRIFIYTGSPTGLNTTPLFTEEVDRASAYFGFSVSGAGDVNNDGYDDVIAGAYNYTYDYTADGLVVYFFGKSNGCETPDDAIASDITSSSATISWTTVDAASTTVYYRITGAGAWSSTTTAGSSVSITGLASCSVYEVKLQSTCGAGIYGGFSEIISFSTDCPCSEPPTGLYADNLTTSTAKLHWDADPYATKYKISYRQTGGSWINVNATSNNKNISGLTAGATYQWKVKTVCGVLQSPFSPISNFTLPLRSEQNTIPEVLIYPNPVQDNLHIAFNHFPEGEINIYLYDMAGRLVNEQVTQQESITINSSDLSPGCYFVHVTHEQTQHVMQIIVQ